MSCFRYSYFANFWQLQSPFLFSLSTLLISHRIIFLGEASYFVADCVFEPSFGGLCTMIILGSLKAHSGRPITVNFFS